MQNAYLIKAAQQLPLNWHFKQLWTAELPHVGADVTKSMNVTRRPSNNNNDGQYIDKKKGEHYGLSLLWRHR